MLQCYTETGITVIGNTVFSYTVTDRTVISNIFTDMTVTGTILIDNRVTRYAVNLGVVRLNRLESVLRMWSLLFAFTF